MTSNQNDPSRAVALVISGSLCEKGGVQALTWALAQEWSRRRPVVLSSNDRYAPKAHIHVSLPDFGQLSECRAWVRRLHALGVHTVFFHLAHTYDFDLGQWAGRPLKACAESGLRIVLVNHYGEASMRWQSDKPILNFLISRWRRWLRLKNMQYMDMEIAVSEFDRKALADYFSPARDKYRVIYHAVWNPEEWSDLLPAGRREKNILCVGHLARRKGQHLLAEAFDQLSLEHPDWTCDIVGPAVDVDMAESLRALPSARSGRLRILPACDDAFARMRRCAIFVLPSLKESLGLALQEAMAAGAACLSSRIGGPLELISDGRNGIFFQVGSLMDLRKKLSRLMLDPSLREFLGICAHDDIVQRGMTRRDMTHAYEQLMHEINF